jgi:PAS domain S-box-containing protein
LNAQSIPLIIMAGLTFYVGAHSVQVYIKQPRRASHASFAASCICMGLYDVFCAGLYSAGTPAEGAPWQRLQLASLALVGIAFSWFVLHFLSSGPFITRRTKVLIGIVSFFFLLMAIAGTAFPAGWYVLPDTPFVKVIPLPFGLGAVYQEVALGPLSTAQSILEVATYLFLFSLALRTYAKGRAREVKALLIAMSIYLASVLSDTAVLIGLYHFAYTMEYAYMGMVILVTGSVTSGFVESGNLREALAANQETLRRHATQLESLRQLEMEITAELDLSSLLKSVVSRAMELLKATTGGIYLYIPERDVIEWQYSIGPVGPPPGSYLRAGEGLSGRVWDQNKTLIVNHYKEWQGKHFEYAQLPDFSTVGSPMHWGNTFFGVLCMLRDPSQGFEPAEGELLELFASQAAVALRNARLFEAARTQTDRLSVVNRIAKTVGATLRLDELRETVYRELATLFAHDSFSITLCEDAPAERELFIRMEEGRRLSPVRFADGPTLVSRVLEEKRTIVVRDLHHEKDGPQAWLGAPVLIGSRITGVISLLSTRREAYAEDDAELLSTIAEQVGAGIERARLYESLHDSEQRYRTLFEQANDAVILQDLDGRILDVNERTCQLLGYPRDDLVGMPASAIVSTRSPLLLAHHLRTAEGTVRVEGEYIRNDGSPVPVEVSMAFLQVAGKPLVFVLAHDITEHIRIEERMRQAQKMEAIGTLAGGIAHDFNNILTGILGYSTLMREELSPGSPLANDVNAIETSARRAAELTQQLLTLSRKNPRVPFAPIDPNRVVTEVVRLLARTIDKSVSIRTSLAEGVNPVNGNAGQLHQALLNLCLNARDAMPQGGEIAIETRNEDPVDRACVDDDKRVFITVRDSGVGMDVSQQERIFEPFFTTKEQGRGLGLAMVYGIVRGHGGDIHVQSAPGKGATFVLSFPACGGSAVEQVTPGGPSPGGGHETVLVVDDEDGVRGVLTRILERAGYSVLQAEDGVRGVEVFRERRERIDLVVLDMIMPRMSGGEAYDRLVEIDPGVKILISSGYSEEGRAAEVLARGAKGFLKKPFGNETVLAMVRATLDGAEPGSLHGGGQMPVR